MQKGYYLKTPKTICAIATCGAAPWVDRHDQLLGAAASLVAATFDGDVYEETSVLEMIGAIKRATMQSFWNRETAVAVTIIELSRLLGDGPSALIEIGRQEFERKYGASGGGPLELEYVRRIPVSEI